MYGLKAEDNGYVSLYVISNFSKVNSPIVYYPVKYKNGKYLITQHCNSISKCGDNLIIATMNPVDKPSAIVISKKGIVKKEMTYTYNNEVLNFSAISYVGTINGKKRFIVKDKDKVKANSFSPTYRLVIMSGTKLIGENILLTLGTDIPKDFVCNDITYTNKSLYVTYYTRNNKNQIYKNFLYEAKINSFVTQTLTVKKKWIAKKTSDETKFEIEGFVINNKIKYAVANCEGASNKDGLFTLKNI